MPTLNDLANARDAATLHFDRAPAAERAVARAAMNDAVYAYEREVRAVEQRQAEAIARAQAVAS